jgi:hypothetical protein
MNYFPKATRACTAIDVPVRGHVNLLQLFPNDGQTAPYPSLDDVPFLDGKEGPHEMQMDLGGGSEPESLKRERDTLTGAPSRLNDSLF